MQMEGGGILSATGYIQVHAYTSYAQIPLQDVAINITDASGGSIAMRLTNRSGNFDLPVKIETPDAVSGEAPNTGIIPFTAVNLYAQLKNYEAIEIENLQIFPNTTTVQNLEMIPLAEFPQSFNKLEVFPTPAQNL